MENPMKKSIFLTALFTLLVVSSVYACAPAAETAPVAPTSIAGEYLTIEYSDAQTGRCNA